MVPDSHETMSCFMLRHEICWLFVLSATKQWFWRCWKSVSPLERRILKGFGWVTQSDPENKRLGHFPAFYIWCWAIFRSIRCFIACDSDPSHPQEKQLWWTLLGLLGSFSYYWSLLAPIESFADFRRKWFGSFACGPMGWKGERPGAVEEKGEVFPGLSKPGHFF